MLTKEKIAQFWTLIESEEGVDKLELLLREIERIEPSKSDPDSLNKNDLIDLLVSPNPKRSHVVSDKKMADKLAEYFETTSSEFWLKI